MRTHFLKYMTFLLNVFLHCCTVPGKITELVQVWGLHLVDIGTWSQVQTGLLLLQLIWVIKQACYQLIFLTGICSPNSLYSMESDRLRLFRKAVLLQKCFYLYGNKTRQIKYRMCVGYIFSLGMTCLPATWHLNCTKPLIKVGVGKQNSETTSWKLLGYYSGWRIGGTVGGILK